MGNTKSNNTTAEGEKVCLIIIDGWGVSDPNTKELDAISAAETPNMTKLHQTSPNTQLIAHGSHVGLPDGLMGNSEVGHLNLGAGRVVYQDITRIDRALQDRTLRGKLLSHLKSGSHVHLVGLVSDGGVHSSLEHLLKLTDILKTNNCDFTIHAITDGRDTAPRSAMTFLPQVFDKNLGTVIGRYYAMDRDKRWERTQLALNAFLLDDNKNTDHFASFEELEGIVKSKYQNNETDEFFKPVIRTGSRRIQSEDTVLFFNFRSDRMRQIVAKFSELGRPGSILCMTRYSEDFDLPVLSPPQSLSNVLSECISKSNLSQCHIAETEKYAHVTFFFNGGKEEPFKGEKRILMPSPKVATYDLQPEMSVIQVAEAVCQAVNSNEHSFVLANLAPPDMVGHTGDYSATLKAVKATDHAVGLISEACAKNKFVLIVTADHGNAEKMSHEGKPHTAHTCAPVPLIVSGSTNTNVQDKVKDCKSLCDVSPLILSLMNLPIPSEMKTN